MNTNREVFPPIVTTPIGHRILDSATKLFREQGIAATSVDSIVDVAGTTKRTLYQRFGSKERLVSSYLQQRAHAWQTELLDALLEVTRAESIRVIYEQTVRWAGESPRGCAFVNAWAEIGAHEHEAVEFIRREKKWMQALFIEVAGGQQDKGRMLHFIYEGAHIAASIQGDPKAFDEACLASQELLSN